MTWKKVNVRQLLKVLPIQLNSGKLQAVQFLRAAKITLLVGIFLLSNFLGVWSGGAALAASSPAFEKYRSTLEKAAAPTSPSPRSSTTLPQGTAPSASPSPQSATLPTTSSGKPNILVIFGDDIGWFNTSAYNRGMMGYKTPNIDRIAKEGVMFTDYYGENSCTAGRAAFIMGQYPFRTGLTKVGLPGADLGIQPEDPTIAELLKPLGYATGQFGKNHLGDRDEFLPTNHGFDEFFGNLYHLNAEEEPENPDYPKNPELKKRFGPRGVLHSYADGRIEDTGSLNKKRMETVDEEFLDASLNFIDKAHNDGKPFFVWFNSTRMHIFTHLKPESDGVTGQGIEADGMVEHDGHVGQLLKKLDDLGIADNTIVIYTTDNGAEFFTWPDGGTTPFHGEKDTDWEGGFRVPAMVRWPGHIPAGVISNEIVSAIDWMPTLLAAAGEPDVVNKTLNGYKAGKKTFKVHLDGYNQLPYLTGLADKSPRKEYFYFTDDGDFAALRYEDWKMLFLEQRATGLNVWTEPLVQLRGPRIFNLRRDPFEKALNESDYYTDWMFRRAFILTPVQAFVGKFIETFKEFPPRQKAASFTVDQVLEKLQTGAAKN
ncbi:MAG: arylsulfatase [Chroococcidiopsidaceae cyanobacterium CP_BM_RX_35]|nr:arylsulfatase [Chroococcidiopsidaceae cyanobacterium CP_BM_RX_35]